MPFILNVMHCIRVLTIVEPCLFMRMPTQGRQRLDTYQPIFGQRLPVSAQTSNGTPIRLDQ